jgi:hypothetical protein
MNGWQALPAETDFSADTHANPADAPDFFSRLPNVCERLILVLA